MKKIILSILLVLSVFLAGSFQPVLAYKSDPAPRLPANHRDRYETDLFTGSATYSYSLNVPKGTNDLTPDLTFHYNSAGSRDHSTSVGLGWQLSRDYVERDTNYTPSNTNDDKFRLHFKGGVYDLVYVSSEIRYHTKTESYLNIQKLTGGTNDKSEYWQVITPDGTKYRFGYEYHSELICNERDFIRFWNLDLVEDTHSNKIYIPTLKSTVFPI